MHGWGLLLLEGYDAAQDQLQKLWPAKAPRPLHGLC